MLPLVTKFDGIRQCTVLRWSNPLVLDLPDIDSKTKRESYRHAPLKIKPTRPGIDWHFSENAIHYFFLYDSIRCTTKDVSIIA